MKSIVVLAAAILLAACDERKAEQLGQHTVQVTTDGYSASVRMITTTDGTRCAILVGLERGGITCDWEGTRKEKQ